ncbi:S-(hydroxymethyl)glutathione dehydrogenase [Malassezia pachydermatis]|uniref:S-(hydroxymethyl)glutathione dehydrogenase n=1 Tax=Malassezia pachydermatis TaxID=77020 RepID=A0A0M8MTC6_9BASI|nr:s- glutathione dehydrogenase [Malassezia pachydermatis]KOS13370.1 s- glutathione dehydrogenase [Malassezia pachydermatis]
MSTEGKTITCKAAIAWEANKPLSVEDVHVAPPRAGEVRVRVTFTGLCHTDVYTLSGSDPEGAFPAVLGHEGAGIVESVGEGVVDVKAGDNVILLYTAECRKCKFCTSGKTNLCQAVRATQGRGVMPDGTKRFTSARTGDELFHFMGTSTFSQYTVVSQYSLVAVDPKAPMDRTCLLGCGVTTGYGAAVYTAKIEPQSTVAVWGVGCVGLAVINGAKERGAKRIIAIDTNPRKKAWAEKFGATDFVNPTEIPSVESGDPMVQYLVDMTDGGLDYTFDCTGNVKVMRTALEACHKGWGVSTIIGVAKAGEEINTRPFQLVTGRRWQGSAFGGVKGRTQLPGIVQRYLEGDFVVDDYVTHRATLGNINDGLKYMHDGDCIRCVVDLA